MSLGPILVEVPWRCYVFDIMYVSSLFFFRIRLKEASWRQSCSCGCYIMGG